METPTIDQFVTADPRREERWHAAKKMIAEGLANKQIWNTEFELAKSNLHAIGEAALEVPYDALLNRLRNDADWRVEVNSEARWAISGYYQFNELPKRIRLLEKMQEPIRSQVEPYLQVCRELVTVGNDLKAVKPFIVKGRKPNPNAPPVEVTMANTGQCAICGRRQKMNKYNAIVDHGFQISDGVHYFGYRAGHCFGVGYEPSELSCKANQAYKKVLENSLSETEETLAELEASNFEQLSETVRVKEKNFNYRNEKRTHLKGTPDYERVRKNNIDRAQEQIRTLKSDINYQAEIIKNWKPSPLLYGSKADQK
jgi:hypothetical protein